MTPDPDTPPRREPPPPWVEFARAPLAPFAVAATVGLCLDRYLGGSVLLGSILAGVALIGWLRFRTQQVWLWFAVLGVALAYHHYFRHVFPSDDIGRIATTEPRVVKLRGVIADDPTTRKQTTTDPLQPRHRKDLDISTVEVQSLEMQGGTWQPTSGRLRLAVTRDDNTDIPLYGLKPGDVAEIVGLLTVPESPGNPGQRDPMDRLLDDRLRADLRCHGAASLTKLDSGDWNVSRFLAYLRGYGIRTIKESLPEERAPVARALLLGDGSAMDRTEWDAFVRTGVVHVLAISGQHLVLLAAFVWFALEILGIPPRRAAWIVAAIVILYAMLTGLRPSALRAAVMVSTYCGTIVLRRRVNPANSFAAAWLVVMMINPADIFDFGGRLSFLSVFVLIWGCGRWFRPRPPTPEERLIASTRSLPANFLRSLIRAIAVAYLVNLILFAVNTPLLIAEQNLVSPIGAVVGPILVMLTSIALVAGFLLFAGAMVPGLGEVLAAVTRVSLGIAEAVVHWADGLPGSSVYTPGLPMVWLLGFYGLLFALVLVGWPRGKRIALLLLGWIAVGLLWPTGPRPEPGEFRIAFLAVGHGSCAVMETPDGRCLLYDTGAVSGPDTVRRVIAPYLWSRGFRRIDEVFLSHADSDHFNGLNELLRRFPVGRVTLTPSFAEKPTAEVAETLNAIAKHRVPMRTATIGLQLRTGDVTYDVRHPPEVGPPGSENERSLVLLIRHAGHTVLLTGDLEKAGTGMLLRQESERIDALQAPHHGSLAAFPKGLTEWATPKFVVVNRGNLYQNHIRDGHAGPGVPVWDTQTRGAVILRSHASGLTAEAFRGGERVVIVRGGK